VRSRNMKVKLLLLTSLLVGCSFHTENSQKKDTSVVQQPQAFRVIVPQATWEPIFFEAINERAAIAKLPSLRAAALPKGDLETRIWIGFGVTALRGFDLQRSSGQWRATYMQGIHSRLTKQEYEITLQAPKSGWEGLWQKLLEQEILTLPDAASIRCAGDTVDGISYVVENNLDNTYRTYMYDNPQFANCQEAQQIIQIAKLFEDEFRPQLPRR
jgi:hypothetical protein